MALELPAMDPCFFCEIVNGRSDGWNVISRDELAITLLNGRQYETGQCVVVPLRHAPTLFELTELEAAAVMASARRAASTMMDAFDPTGILLYQNNGVGSGQEVPHFHLHVVPRQPGSDWGLGPPHIARLESRPTATHLDHAIVTNEKKAIVELLRRCWRTG